MNGPSVTAGTPSRTRTVLALDGSASPSPPSSSPDAISSLLREIVFVIDLQRQLMKIGWQYLLPLAIANLILTAIFMMRVEVWGIIKEAGGRALAYFGLG